MAQPWHVRILPGRGCAFIGITVFGSIVESVEQDFVCFWWSEDKGGGWDEIGRGGLPTKVLGVEIIGKGLPFFIFVQPI